ncbi:hypothetical protein HELRODRAFT_184789 [Helobdella robusta]|uniref:Uncharacterized protein n=1 Tax=Helobdella robusta TaxID=6412 RepID=T1FM01_HELRO|nr:hypothetical protein HELRODRAFT_184789 [Helobdella robusta]ESN97817.1 hypothetical protein HELRODRAFT_184789 [Helobdella robusta]
MVGVKGIVQHLSSQQFIVLRRHDVNSSNYSDFNNYTTYCNHFYEVFDGYNKTPASPLFESIVGNQVINTGRAAVQCQQVSTNSPVPVLELSTLPPDIATAVTASYFAKISFSTTCEIGNDFCGGKGKTKRNTLQYQ